MGEHGQDVIGKNAYVLFNSKEDRTKIAKSMNDARSAYDTLKQGDPNRQILLGVYLHLSLDPENADDDKNIPKFARHDVYLSAVLGAQIIIIWSLFNRNSVHRTYDVPVEKPVYESKKNGDALTFLRPPSEQR